MARTPKTYAAVGASAVSSGDPMEIEDLIRNALAAVVGLYVVLKVIEILFNVPIPFV